MVSETNFQCSSGSIKKVVHQSIFIKDINGRTMTFPYDPCVKINQYLKNFDLPNLQRRIIFGGKQLKEECTLLDYGIFPDSTLHLVLSLLGGGFDITVNCSGMRTITVTIESNDTVYELKKQIAEKTGILIKHQQLVIDGTRVTDNSKALSEYKLHQGSKIFLGMPLKASGTKSYGAVIIKEMISEPIQPGIQPGLNLKRECLDFDCGMTTWVNRAFGTCNIKMEVNKDPCFCNSKTKIVNMGFYECSFSIEGEYTSSSGMLVNLVKNMNRVPKGEFLVCKDENVIVKYNYLQIRTERNNLPAPQRSDEDRLLPQGVAQKDGCCCHLF